MIRIEKRLRDCTAPLTDHALNDVRPPELVHISCAERDHQSEELPISPARGITRTSLCSMIMRVGTMRVSAMAWSWVGVQPVLQTSSCYKLPCRGWVRGRCNYSVRRSSAHLGMQILKLAEHTYSSQS